MHDRRPERAAAFLLPVWRSASTFAADMKRRCRFFNGVPRWVRFGLLPSGRGVKTDLPRRPFFRAVVTCLLSTFGFMSIVQSATQTTPPRSEIPEKYRWDLSVMYASDQQWQEHYRQLESRIADLAALKGTLGESPEALLKALQLRDDLNVQIEKLYAYAVMAHHEDMTQPAPLARYQKAQTLATRYEEATSWFQPELLQIPEERLKAWLQRPELAIYGHYFDDLLRSRAHILSPREEQLLAMSSKAVHAADQAYSLLTNTELQWRKVRDPEGNLVEMTTPMFYQALYSKDRSYRRRAFEAYCSSFLDVKGTLAATLAGTMEADWFYSRARHYGSSLERSLDAENLPVSVYHNLIRTIRRHLPLLHRYTALKKKALGLDEVHFYDLYVNLVDIPEKRYTFEQARDLVLAGIEPFGPEYQAVMRKAFESRWIDVLPNRGKMSGAYNMGTYLSPPYVLLNFTGTFNDVSTVAHELGHAMQSWFAAKNQPPVYAGYPMFTAEVASTAAEIVFKRFMLRRTSNPAERAFLLNQMLEDMRQTVFRQTKFAEFDLAAHQMAEKGEPMTAEAFMSRARQIHADYYGPEFVMDPELDVECLRIPHYYRNFYVYRYATSYCAAAAIARRILEGDPRAVEDWMAFLKAGNSLYALDMLKLAGVDMTTPKPIEEAMALFEELLTELEPLLSNTKAPADSSQP